MYFIHAIFNNIDKLEKIENKLSGRSSPPAGGVDVTGAERTQMILEELDSDDDDDISTENWSNIPVFFSIFPSIDLFLFSTLSERFLFFNKIKFLIKSSFW